VERLLILSAGESVAARDVDRLVHSSGAGGNSLDSLIARFEQFADFRDEAEKIFIEHKLSQYDWNVSKTAEAIGIQRSHLYNKMNKYGIER
jgi:DNA-binding NtrC family response regulator